MFPKRKSRLLALTNQISRLERRINGLESLSRKFFWYRLITILITGGIIFAAISLLDRTGVYISIIFSITIFSIIVYYHRHVDSWIRRFNYWKQIKAHQLAQMQLDWEHLPTSGVEPYAQKPNPLQVDLDLTGDNSLHQLIDRTISIEGSNLLRDWLSQSEPDPGHIKKYQKIVKELVPISLFRDKLTLNFQLVSRNQLKGESLLKWLAMPYPSKTIKRLLPISSAFILINISLFLLNLFGYLPPYWIITFLLYAVFYFYNQNYLQVFLDAVVVFDTELDKFKTILDYIENYLLKEDQEALKHLLNPIFYPNNPPSKILKRVKIVTSAVGLRNNPILMLLLNTIFPWDFYFSWLVSRYQEDLSIRIPIWLRILQELDASISLANFAYLNPEYTFPQFNGAQSEISPILEAHAIGHPLIRPQQKICNQFTMNNLGEIFIITGSNMAGKSTFVKTIGINLMLAYSGGPVNAQILKTNLFSIHTCIRISDSITDGFSYFYAEVKCLKNLWEATISDEPYPTLFLIDEIFRGTNNKERLIGSKAYIQNISGKRCAGLIATHDLELAKLADENEFVKNFHFRDDVRDGKLVFDYKLRPGPSPTTNALKIMDLEGLPL